MGGPKGAAVRAAAAAKAAKAAKTKPTAKSSKADAEKQRLKEAGKTFAAKNVRETFAESSIEDRTGDFPKFSKEEITLGKILGKGGFGTVYEVRGFEAGKAVKRSSNSIVKALSSRNVVNNNGGNNNNDHDDEVKGGELENRKFIADHCLRNSGETRYAAKLLSPEVTADPASFIQGIIDMAVETRVMSDTDHPNIVRMRALANQSPYNDSYFIVMDRLFDILENRIASWDKLYKKCTGMQGRLFDRNGEKVKELNEKRMVAAFDLSSALEYLHGRKIIYRDIKPENIGFDIRDDIKLFDFGLATELKDSRKTDDGMYKLTEMTGSPRYMAPEVGNGANYNEKCDVYSFAILLWQMESLKTPFELFTMKSLRSRVWNGENKRPHVVETWPVPIKNLLRRAWSKQIGERPRFVQITKILRKECVRIRNGNEDGLEHSRRRSTFVFRGARGQLTSTSTAQKRFSGAAGVSSSLDMTPEEDEEEAMEAAM